MVQGQIAAPRGASAVGVSETARGESTEHRWRKRTGSFFDAFSAALIIVSPVAPLVAALLSVLAVQSGLPYPFGFLFLAPLVNAVLAWVALAFVATGMGLTTAAGALRGTYGELVQNLDELENWSRLLPETGGRPGPFSVWSVATIRSQVREIHQDLARVGAEWFLGTGYLNLWRRVHWAQEALARLVPADVLPSFALAEIHRLQGSEIDGRDAELSQLRTALTLLGTSALPDQARQLLSVLDSVDVGKDPSAILAIQDAVAQLRGAVAQADGLWEPDSLRSFQTLNYQLVLAPTTDQVVQFTGALRSALAGLKPVPMVQVPGGTPPEQHARDLIVAARQKMDGYRDAKRAGLLRVRSELIATITVAALLVYALLWTVMAALWIQPDASSILAGFAQGIFGAAILFEVGAVTGLFLTLAGRDGDMTNTDARGEDDYGASIVRLMGAPILGGVGGLGGVLLVAFGKAALDGINRIDSMTFWQVFSPGTSPLSLLVAAAFGLSPKYLLDGLSQRATQFQQSLQASNVGGGASSPASGASASKS